MKQILKPSLGASVVRRAKGVITTLILSGTFSAVSAQVVDGRDFSVDGFAAVSGNT